jgi:aconitate hydratase
MLALSADAVEVAAAMAGEPFQFTVPKVLRILLQGKSRPFISPKDIGLELIRRRGVAGVTGYALEFDGAGARALGVYERATIANLGATLGAVTTVFPSDEKTRIFLQRERRSKSWRRIEADNDATYDETETIDLGALEPLVLCGHGQGEVRPVRELQGEPVHEVNVGSCANASIRDLIALAGVMKGKKVHPDCVFTVSPSSRQALEVLARGEGIDSSGSLADLISAGVRILESGCTHCNRPSCLPKGSNSVRTFVSLNPCDDGNKVFVVSPETAAACAINGQVTDPRKLRRPPRIKLPRQLPVDDSMIIKPHQSDPEDDIALNPSTPDIPAPERFDGDLKAHVVGCLGHGARLDQLAPDSTWFEASAKPSKSSKRPKASKRKKASKGASKSSACVVAGQSLGYRLLTSEVALAHRQKGLRVVIAEGFAPPCEISLAHAGVVPLTFLNADDSKRVKAGDELLLGKLADRLRQGETIPVSVAGNGVKFEVSCSLDERSRDVLISGGLLEFLKQNRL